MTIAFVSALANPWSTLVTGATSPSFTPGAGDTLLVWSSDFNASGITITGTSGTYTIINPPGQWPDTEGDGYALGNQLSAIAVSQTISIGAATSSDTIGHWVRFSGVGSISATSPGGVNNLAPGNAVGSIVGTSVTVPLGAVLVAWASAEDALESMAVANGGTQVLNAADSNNLIQLCIGYWVGTGAAVQPKFTPTIGANKYTVLQTIILPPVGSTAAPMLQLLGMGA